MTLQRGGGGQGGVFRSVTWHFSQNLGAKFSSFNHFLGHFWVWNSLFGPTFYTYHKLNVFWLDLVSKLNIKCSKKCHGTRGGGQLPCYQMSNGGGRGLKKYHILIEWHLMFRYKRARNIWLQESADSIIRDPSGMHCSKIRHNIAKYGMKAIKKICHIISIQMLIKENKIFSLIFHRLSPSILHNLIGNVDTLKSKFNSPFLRETSSYLIRQKQLLAVSDFRFLQFHEFYFFLRIPTKTETTVLFIKDSEIRMECNMNLQNSSFQEQIIKKNKY